jgi:elongator complex protein 1
MLACANIVIKGALQILEYLSTAAAGSTAPPHDFGMVASIDGREFQVMI